MKYFKKNWYANDKLAEKIVNNYNQQLQEILNGNHDILLNAYLKKLVFHDSIIHKVELKNAILKMHILLGDNQLGYFKCGISFKHVSTNVNDLNVLPVTVLYTETFCSKKGYRTNFLLLDDFEFFIEFLEIDNLDLKRCNFSDYKNIEKHAEKYTI